MRAVVVERLDGPAAVTVTDVDDPVPGDGEVLLEVHAGGVSFPDVLLTQGKYQMRPEPPFILGSEAAGVVRSAPPGARVKPGDRVAALSVTGGFAELVTASTDLVFPLPASVSYAAGAALPLNYLTVEFALSHRGRVAAGETVLVHGAAGGVGTAAVQFARALGARVIAVVSTAAKEKVARAAGAHETVPVDGFLAQVRELTGGRGVDVVVDPVGGDRFTDSLRALASDGRLLVIGFTGGDIPTVRVNRLLLNNIEVVGVGWGEYVRTHPGYAAAQWERLLPYVESGALDPALGGTYPLDRAADALAELDERRVTGKLILLVRDGAAEPGS